jgi:hypothetical protein
MPLGHRAHANNRMIVEHSCEQLLPLVQRSTQHNSYLRGPFGPRAIAVKKARLDSQLLTGVCWARSLTLKKGAMKVLLHPPQA